MSAKKYSPSKKSPPSTPAPTAAASAVAVAGALDVASPTSEPSWMDSTDPRKRAIAKVLFVALWIYVAALWLLALDQWFNWGIFGPKIPPVP